MKTSLYIITIFCLLICSCNRIKNKGKKIANKTEQTIKSKSKNLLDKVFPQFDAYKPDTKYNKERFQEYLGVELTPDVKNIYCFGDFIGVDYKVLFSFGCDSTTVKKIIKKKRMKLSTQKYDNGLYFLDEFKWWNKKRINGLKPYKVGKENKYWKYLWYDKENQKVYYEEFSL